ncbi:Flp/Fap pilin component [Anatilimnocola aggregata]|uniref:Flp/Fap pilin component n=1 Tax=Anatilimnocola aggregata TaxID=2528021 RepID=A0A517YK33_9BACT|nr:Flp family type IVb pilin [Anatilimnocola aggregata]QDU30585.1 Flp/Fap pilin component [Anatilimnocola aggregata]
MKLKATLRRGATAVQVAVVLGAVTLVVIGSISQLGSASKSQMTQVASNVGNPSSLVGSFGSASGSSSGSSGSGDSSGSSGSSSSGGSSSGESTDSGSSGGSSGGSSVCP